MTSIPSQLRVYSMRIRDQNTEKQKGD